MDPLAALRLPILGETGNPLTSRVYHRFPEDGPLDLADGRGPQSLHSPVGLADVLKVLKAGFQGRRHPFSSLEMEVATAVHSQ